MSLCFSMQERHASVRCSTIGVIAQRQAQFLCDDAQEVLQPRGMADMDVGTSHGRIGTCRIGNENLGGKSHHQLSDGHGASDLVLMDVAR